MVPAGGRSKKPQDTYTLLGARITHYEMRVTAGLNADLKLADRRVATPQAPLYTYITTLQIEGMCTYPDERAGEQYDLLIVGDSHAAKLQLTLEDIHVRDASCSRQYRQYRGEDVPVYAPPPGISIMYRGTKRRVWHAYLTVAPHLATDMLTGLATGAASFLSLHEHRVGRQRWIDSLTLQSTDPAEE